MPRLFAILLLSTSLSSPAWSKSKSKSHISAGIRQPLLVLTVDNEGADAIDGNDQTRQELVFEPKIPTIGVLGVSWNSLSLSYSHNLDGESEDDLEYYDYRLGYFWGNYGGELTYTEFERFRINESSGFDSSLSDRDLRYPDMATDYFSANLYAFPLAFNFDLEKSFAPEEAKATGVGLGVIASFNQITIDTRNGLVPKDWREAFGPDGGFESGQLSSTNLAAALGVTLAPGVFYVSGMVALGLGNQSFAYETETQSRSGGGVALKDNLRLAAGYSAKRTFLALAFHMETPTYILRNMAIGTESTDFSTIFGINF